MKEETGKQSGDRYNIGKLRYDLLPIKALEGMTSVMTYGANKYTPRNWEKGLSWTETAASLLRHTFAFLSGEDIDLESGLPHVDHIMCNAGFLGEYYRTHPEFDDRPVKRIPKIALDVDEVLADFVARWIWKFGGTRPIYWNYDFYAGEKWDLIREDQDFWLGIEPKISTLPFEPVAYISSRQQPVEWTIAWLSKCGFPSAPVIHVPRNASKLEAFESTGAEIFVDDRYDTFIEFRRAGKACFLMDAPHNRTYDVGVWRLKDLNELILKHKRP